MNLMTLILILSLSGCVHLENSEKLDRACTFGAFVPAPVLALVGLVAGCYIAVDQIEKKELEEEEEEEECDEDDEECLKN